MLQSKAMWVVFAVVVWHVVTWFSGAVQPSFAQTPQEATQEASTRVATTKAWNAAGVIDGYDKEIYSLAFGPRSTLVAGDASGVRVWDAATKKEFPFYQRLPENASAITGITYAPDDTWVSLRGQHEFHLAYGQYLKEGCPTDWGHGASDRKNQILWPLAIAPDGETYALRSMSKRKNVVDVAVHEFVRKSGKKPSRIQATCRGHLAEAECAAFSPDGQLLATGSSDKTVRLWNPTTGLEVAVLRGHSDTISVMEFSPDGKLLATGGRDTTIRFWDVADQKERALLPGKAGIRCIAFAKDGTSLAGGDEGGNLCIWNVKDAKLKSTLTDHTGTIFAVAFSRDGKLLASGGQD